MSDLLLAYLPSTTIALVAIVIIGISGYLSLFQAKKSHWMILGLLIWLPIETVMIRFVPIDLRAYARYVPELVLYVGLLFAYISYIRRTHNVLPHLPLLSWVALYIGMGVLSWLTFQYDPLTFAFGIRQLLRFFLIIFYVHFMQYDEHTVKEIVWVAFACVIGQVGIGLLQYLAQGRLDPYLFTSTTLTIGNTAIISEIPQFWAPGSRIFATMGRYDQLGSLLAICAPALLGFIYTKRTNIHPSRLLLALILVLLALFLTKSRASWLAALAAMTVIGFVIKKDWRFITGGLIAAVLFGTYLLGFALVNQNISAITETRNQSVAERVFEAVSLRAWQDSYDGHGRIYFIINTPLRVVSLSPVFGVGPGQYGGGVAAARLNTAIYDRVLIPFGIQGQFGQIDNSWFSLWGEVGTVGAFAWLGLFGAIIRMAYFVYNRTTHAWIEAISLGTIGATSGMIIIGFFGPYFEFRTTMFYYWLMVAIVVLYYTRYKSRGDFLTRRWQ